MDYEERIFAVLSGKCKHYCPDWDGMAIDENCPEFEHCLCEFENKPTVKTEVTEIEGDDLL